MGGVAVCAALGAAAGWALVVFAERLLSVPGGVGGGVGAVVVGAGLSGVIGWRYEGQGVLLAMLWLAWFGVSLSIIDVRHRRLPDALVGALFVGGVVLLGVGVLSGAEGAGDLARALAASGVVLVVGLLGVLVAGGGIGRGDVTFSAALALYLGVLGWTAVMVGFLLGALLLAVAAASIVAVRGGGRHRRLAAGPALYVGAVTAVVAFAPGG